MHTPTHTTRHLLAATALALGLAGAAAAESLPGKGIAVQPLKSSIAEETFQTHLVMKALEALGYTVKPIKEVEYPTAHIAIANAMPPSWPTTGTPCIPTSTRMPGATPSSRARACIRTMPRRAI